LLTYPSVQVLVDHALALTKSDGTFLMSKNVFPDDDRWKKAIELETDRPLDPVLGALMPSAGAAYVANNSRPSDAWKVEVLLTDNQGFTIAERIALYTSQIMLPLWSTLWTDQMTTHTHSTLLTSMLLTYDVMTTRLEAGATHGQITKYIQNESTNIIEQHLERCAKIFGKISEDAEGWREYTMENGKGVGRFCQIVGSTVDDLLSMTKDATPYAYHSMRALARLLQALHANKESKATDIDVWVAKLDILTIQQHNAFGAAAIMFGIEDQLQGNKTMRHLCEALINRVVSAQPDAEKTLPLLVYANASMNVFEGDLPFKENQQQHRLLRAANTIMEWIRDLQVTDLRLASEVCHFLLQLLPSLPSQSGSLWETSLKFCADIWDSTAITTLNGEGLAAVGMSLMLFSTLRGMRDRNNETLNAALDDFTSKRAWSSLLRVLQLPRNKDTRPLRVIDERLSRILGQLPLNPKLNLTGFYSLLASEFKDVQTAAFRVLQKNLPNQQEEYSLEIALMDIGKNYVYVP
jgi:hypothetical protein